MKIGDFKDMTAREGRDLREIRDELDLTCWCDHPRTLLTLRFTATESDRRRRDDYLRLLRSQS